MQHLIPDTLLWHGQGLLLRPAEPEDVPDIVQLHRRLIDEKPPDDRINSPEAWFRLGGAWMHEYFCARHLKVYRDRGFDVWVLVADGDEIVGNVELWYDVEPEPFGRYGHIELLELTSEVFVDEVEDWILQKSEERARERGYGRFWCRPIGSGGGSHLLRQRGYQGVWRNGHVVLQADARYSPGISLHRFEPPLYAAEDLSGDYEAEASHLSALNHREAAGYRWGYIWRPVLDPARSDFPTEVGFWGSRVRFSDGGGGICLVSVWRWWRRHSWMTRHPPLTQVDLWVHPELAGDVENTRALLAVAAEQAWGMGAETVTAYVPESLATELAGGDIERLELEMGDPWYLKTLE